MAAGDRGRTGHRLAGRLPRLVAGLAALGGVACSTSPDGDAAQEAIRIQGLSFENRSRSSVTGIRLLVPATQNFVSCGHIAPSGVCSSAFPGVDYRGTPVQVSWTQDGQTWTTGEIRLQADEQVRRAGVGRVRVIVLAPGSAGAVLVSDGLSPP